MSWVDVIIARVPPTSPHLDGRKGYGALRAKGSTGEASGEPGASSPTWEVDQGVGLKYKYKQK